MSSGNTSELPPAAPPPTLNSVITTITASPSPDTSANPAAATSPEAASSELNVPVGGGSRKTRPSKSTSSVSPLIPTCQPKSSYGSDVDLAAVFARFLNTQPQTLTTSTEYADPFHNLTAEKNSQISSEELSDILQDPKQGITEDYETFPFELQTQFGVEDFDSFSSNYNANH